MLVKVDKSEEVVVRERKIITAKHSSKISRENSPRHLNASNSKVGKKAETKKNSLSNKISLNNSINNSNCLNLQASKADKVQVPKVLVVKKKEGLDHKLKASKNNSFKNSMNTLVKNEHVVESKNKMTLKNTILKSKATPSLLNEKTASMSRFMSKPVSKERKLIAPSALKSKVAVAQKSSKLENIAHEYILKKKGKTSKNSPTRLSEFSSEKEVPSLKENIVPSNNTKKTPKINKLNIPIEQIEENSNTSMRSTLRDNNYYLKESEKLQNYIKTHFSKNNKYPETSKMFYKYGRVI